MYWFRVIYMSVAMFQVKEDVYENINKELLEYVEDVLLNRCSNSTERLLQYSATIERKCKPTAVKKLGGEAVVDYPTRVNHRPHDPLAPVELPPVPVYKEWVDPVEKSSAFAELDELFKQRICFIDGAMGTCIQVYKLEEEDYRGERYKVGHVS